MKSGIRDTLGKTISGIVVATNVNSPKQQVFLTFSDGTYFEFWGELFSCAGGVVLGGIPEASMYAAKVMGSEITKVYRPKAPPLPSPPDDEWDPPTTAEKLGNIAACIFGLQALFVVPWLLGAFYRFEQSTWPWIAFADDEARHGAGDAYLGLYLQAIFYSTPVALTYILGRSSRAGKWAMAFPLWVGLTFILVLPGLIALFRNISPPDEWGRLLVLAWIGLSFFAFPILRRRLSALFR